MTILVIIVIVLASVMIIKTNSENGSSDGIQVESFDGNFTPIVQTYNEIPERIIVGNYTALEMLLYFNLQDRIVGIFMNNEAQVWEPLEERYDALINRLGSNVFDSMMPQASAVNLEPDLIMGYATSFTSSGIGTVEFWNSIGCNTWVNWGVAHYDKAGITKDALTIDFTNLGKVFDIEDQTSEYLGLILSKIDDHSQQYSFKYALIDGWFDDYFDLSQLYCYGNNYVVCDILNLLGGTNIYSESGSYSGATLIDNPDVDLIFIIHEPYLDFQEIKLQFLNSSLFEDVSAVRNEEIYSIGFGSAYAGIRTSDLIDTFVRILDEDNLRV